ncbi:hypothetical protein IQ260_26940 [Leptolyngbya cf. ectocarpi LEGE 11479]|uniref:Uncharacterized protein n=1 Tax=Leptolyngbya cf. ectocarpi LEGE 11479 TaxID=1828722 RepID=A0A929FD58_LEPEC|nr:hypothetical protein [Leptolyngbya ectocarpi]MBE9070283.1 hypothetical protein [Leptolyngbya cf. ectocarpi LEGE 11479]
MQYLYSFANVSLSLRVMDRLSQMCQLPLESLTVIYLVDRWVMHISLRQGLSAASEKDLLAFLKENGMPHTPSMALRHSLQALTRGQTPTQVMNEYQVVVVSHGVPDPTELHEFCARFVEGLGYYPPSLV